MSGLPDVAKAFQSSGITAMIYDPRSTGLSDGSPRNEIDPIKQTEDFSDALTYFSRLPTVDPDQMGIFGISFSGAVALSTASLDKRVKFVLAICPASEYQYSPEKIKKVLAKCIKDRESQIKGNEPYYIPMINDQGGNPAGFNFGLDKVEGAKIVKAARELGMEGVAPHHVNRTTIQSYYKLIMWQPSPLWKNLDHTPVLFVVPELDIMCPPEVQRRYYNALPCPKRWHLEEGRGHMDITEGDHLANLVKVQIAFVHDALQGKVTSGTAE
jgi:pimeloyl-ACP methyl ester carboxylesterase